MVQPNDFRMELFYYSSVGYGPATGDYGLKLKKVADIEELKLCEGVRCYGGHSITAKLAAKNYSWIMGKTCCVVWHDMKRKVLGYEIGDVDKVAHDSASNMTCVELKPVKKHYVERYHELAVAKVNEWREFAPPKRLGFLGSDYDAIVVDEAKHLMKKQREKRNRMNLMPEIERIIFHDPATIVYWSDGTKTVVKANQSGKKRSRDKFREDYGLAMAISKKFAGGRAEFNHLVAEAERHEKKGD